MPLPDLPPGETVKITLSCVPRCRGYLYLSGVAVARSDALGILNRLVKIKQPDKILILPQIDAVPPLDLVSSRHYHRGGVSLASSIGNSDEFISLRGYRPGDPLRNIHWKSVAKTSQMVMKEFEDEHFVRHSLILDTFTTPENEMVFESAVRLAASYVCQLQGPEAILDLMFAGEKVFSVSKGRGLGRTGKMLEVLACVECNTRHRISDLLPVLTENLSRISGSVCIFLEWDEDRKAVYDTFKQADIDVQVFVVSRDKAAMTEKIAKSLKSLHLIKVVAV